MEEQFSIEDSPLNPESTLYFKPGQYHYAGIARGVSGHEAFLASAFLITPLRLTANRGVRFRRPLLSSREHSIIAGTRPRTVWTMPPQPPEDAVRRAFSSAQDSQDSSGPPSYIEVYRGSSVLTADGNP